MLGEGKILAALPKLFLPSSSVTIPIGDDCAEVKFAQGKLLAASDQVVESVHVSPDTAPAAAGRKLLCRNVSDIAAMGGTPRWALLTICASGKSPEYLLEFGRGVAAAAENYSISVIGGDVAALDHPGLVATLTILGESPVAGAVCRAGARAGDWLYLTGKVGNSFASGRHLTFAPRLAEGQFLAENRLATAMLDISDGLLLDAARLARASQVDLELDREAIPLHADAALPGALSDGEDYELLFTAPHRLESEWRADLTPITCIGRCLPGDGEVRDRQGNSLLTGKLGYEH